MSANGQAHPQHSDPGVSTPVTLRTLRRMASAGDAFACLTCYDATTARWLARAGVHVLLVGDTAAETVLGYSSTVHMPMDIAVALTGAVKRGAPHRVVMADMPFMSYQAEEADAIRNAGRFITEGSADIVKLEVDASFGDLVGRLARAGIPVCAHIGARPQTAGLTGGYASAGRTDDTAERIVADARAMERAGAVMVLIEAVPSEVADRVVAETTIPVIGIGAGPAPHGQIVVLNDLIGLSDWQPPFAPRLGEVGEQIRDAASAWVGRVAAREVTTHRYAMKPTAAQAEPAR
ncbi:MAG: 3-methyl-2-oxobutanoate hydroxymethyltransferase [Planctomycetota bacterium]